MVDGAENNYPTYSSGQHVRPILLAHRASDDPGDPGVLQALGGASPEDQELIKRLAKEAQRQRELWYAERKKALAEMKANGVEVVEVEHKEMFRDAVKPVWDKHGG